MSLPTKKHKVNKFGEVITSIAIPAKTYRKFKMKVSELEYTIKAKLLELIENFLNE